MGFDQKLEISGFATITENRNRCLTSIPKIEKREVMQANGFLKKTLSDKTSSVGFRNPDKSG
jgi:hypothetical protein